jgi:hypothetical protein
MHHVRFPPKAAVGPLPKMEIDRQKHWQSLTCRSQSPGRWFAVVHSNWRNVMRLILALSALSLIASPVAATAPCHDAHGKFVKCTKVVKKAARCRDAHGKFIKCTKVVTKTQRCHDAKGHFIKCK